MESLLKVNSPSHGIFSSASNGWDSMENEGEETFTHGLSCNLFQWNAKKKRLLDVGPASSSLSLSSPRRSCVPLKRCCLEESCHQPSNRPWEVVVGWWSVVNLSFSFRTPSTSWLEIRRGYQPWKRELTFFFSLFPRVGLFADKRFFNFKEKSKDEIEFAVG